MKIIQVIYSLNQGGAERFTVDLSNELSKNHEVYLITLRNDKIKGNYFYKNEIESKVKYINFPLERGIRLRDIINLNKFVNGLKPDIIHSHLNVIYYFLFNSIWNNKTKFIHTIHNDAFFEGRLRIASSIRKFFYKRKWIIPITISNESKKSFENFYNIKNPVLIYNGRKNLQQSPLLQEVQTKIESLKHYSDDLVFLHVSRYNKEAKNHQMLIDTFNILVKEGLHAIMIIVGKDYEINAKNLIENSGDYVYFLGEKLNIADYLLSSDAFCLTSLYEGLPISLLEAMACGCIPICTPAGGIKDIIQDGENGFISSDFTKNEYLATMKRFLKYKDAIAIESLKETFNQNFSIEKCAKKHINIYES